MNMDMDMDMSSPTSSGMQAHSTPMPSMSTMDSMSGMSSTFSSSTRVTLWFTGWTTTTTATYVLTIFFLFFLGMFNRFLGALKTQLERKWKAQLESNNDTNTVNVGRNVGGGGLTGHVRRWSRALGPQFTRLDHHDRDLEQESEPLSPVPQRVRAGGEDEKQQANKPARPWVAHAPWSIKRDGISAGLEFIRALIGYILMLAVMTYNVGFLFAVTGSVLLGELVFGRYTRGGGQAGWVEGGCHE